MQWLIWAFVAGPLFAGVFWACDVLDRWLARRYRDGGW